MWGNICEVTTAMVALGDVEGRCCEAGGRSVHVVMSRLQRGEKKKEKPYAGSCSGDQTQMWTDLLVVGVDQDKIDFQSNAVLLELWQQLKPEQQFRHGQKRPTERARLVALKDFLKLQDPLLTLYD